MGIVRKIQRSVFGFFKFGNLCWLVIVGAWLSGAADALADGCFIFHWDKQKDINEPTQKAIILHDNGREDLVLQVKYEGPAEEFGWLVPVPSLPDVRKGSMDCFYELSKLTQQTQQVARMGISAGPGSHTEYDSVNINKIETVGAYEVAILSAGNAAKLTEWLDANGFEFPKEKQDVLDGYIKKHWQFVAVKINPKESGFVVRHGGQKIMPAKKTIPESTRAKLASGELNPLVISFDSAKCVYPLAISSVNGKPSELSLYVLSAEPLISRTIFDKKFVAFSRERENWIQKAPERAKAREDSDNAREQKMRQQLRQLGTNYPHWGRSPRNDFDDPADPPPPRSVMERLLEQRSHAFLDGSEYPMREQLILGIEASPENLAACAKQLPPLAGKSWWLTKHVQTFAPDEMQDLEFERAVPILASNLSAPGGRAAAVCLKQFGRFSVPSLLAAARSSNSVERQSAAAAFDDMRTPSVIPIIPVLLTNPDPYIRRSACWLAGDNWQDKFAPQLVELLRDSDAEVRHRAASDLRNPDRLDASNIPMLKEMVDKDSPGAAEAINFLDVESYPRPERIHFLSSTNLPVVARAFTGLRHTLTLDELAPLLTNSLPMARMMALGELSGMRDEPAIDRMIGMLHDPNQAIRWNVRSRLRQLTGQKLGPEPAAYEKWWKENKSTYAPPVRAGFGGE